MTNFMSRKDLALFLGFSALVVLLPILATPFGAAYPDLLQRFMIFGIFAIGINIMFGLTGYLSFGHAAFFGGGSDAAMWSFKLLSLHAEIGRESCRERVCPDGEISVVAETLKKKKNSQRIFMKI